MLIGVLVSSLFGDIAWIVKLVRSLFVPDLRRDIVTFAIRLGWSFLITQYQIFALFLAHFCNISPVIKRINNSLIVVGCALSTYFAYSAFFEKMILSKIERTYYLNQPFFSTAPTEIIAMRGTVIYLFFFGLWIAFLLMNAFQKKDQYLPKIIKKQLLFIFSYFAIPYLMYDFSMIVHFMWRSTHAFTHLIVGTSTFIFTFGMYYCVKQILKMRFLNCKEVVESAPRPSFVYYFQEIIEKLHAGQNLDQLNHLTDEFFETNFSVPSTNVMLLVRNQSTEEAHVRASKSEHVIHAVEKMLTDEHASVYSYLKKEKIIIYDDLMLTDFYNPCRENSYLIEFLRSIRADIFLPIIDNEQIIAFIIIHQNARVQLYSDIDRHEMILFAKYLATRINAFLHDTTVCSHQEKKLKDDLYKKNLEVAHYKESIRSFLAKSQSQEIGIIFFNNNRFEYANESAKKLAEQMGTKESHPLLTSFKNSVRHVERYQTPYNCYTCDGKGNRYLITTVYNHAGNNCIISVSRADLSESITEKIALLNNPSRYDYLLYLETTKPGHRINNLIPGSCAELLNFKLQLLEVAFSKKPVLLHASKPDQDEIVTYLHQTSSREVVHTIDAQEDGIDFNTLLLGCDKTKQLSLLEKLNNVGTLHIINIDYLNMSLQKKLADVIKYGFFTRTNSDKKISVNVRIVCSTSQKISSLNKQLHLSSELHEELKDSILSMPEIKSLALPELVEIGQKYLLQENLPVLSYDYLTALFKHAQPTSLHELKTIVFEHSQRESGSLIESNDYLHTIKPELAQAARLGKHALKNPLIMSQLWQTFKSQARIADYLGVNRSSVSRRCKEYSLID